MERIRSFFAALIMVAAMSSGANADDAVLSGTITSAAVWSWILRTLPINSRS